MRPWFVIAIPALIVACEKDDTAVEYGLLEGTVTTDDGETGTVSGAKIFAYDKGGEAMLYVASNSAATCAEVTEYLGSDRDADPSNLFVDGGCNAFAFISEFDQAGSSFDSNPDGDSWTKVSWVLNCAMGEGEFEYLHQGQDSGYYWSGRWWQGGPNTWNLTLSGGGGEGMVLDAEMNDYDGNYIYEGLDEVLASGLVSGSNVQAEWCEDLSESDFFTN